MNGYFTDITACTYYFMAMSDVKKYAFYVEKNIDMFQDIFFIPSIHPYCQLHFNGEFWHARTKIGKDSKIQGISKFDGKFNEYSENIVKTMFPKYLVSNNSMKEIEKKYKLFEMKNKKVMINFNKFEDTYDVENIYQEYFGGGKQKLVAKLNKYIHKLNKLNKNM